MQAQWDTGYLIGMYATISLTAICALVAIIAAIIYWRKDSDGALATAAVAGVCFLIVGAIGTFISFPWSGQYHRYVPVSGTVAQTGSRFLASGVNGGGSDQKFVFTFTDGRSYGVLDTRAANVRPGSYVQLLCKRSFQFNAPVQGWDCNFVSATPPK